MRYSEPKVAHDITSCYSKALCMGMTVGWLMLGYAAKNLALRKR